MTVNSAKSASPSREIQADYLFACSVGTAGTAVCTPISGEGLVMMTKVKGQHGAQLQLVHVLFPKSQLATLSPLARVASHV